MFLRRRGRSVRQQAQVSVLVNGGQDIDMSDYVVITAMSATDSPDRQIAQCRQQVDTGHLEEQVLHCIKDAEERKSSVVKVIRGSADFLDKQQRDMNIAKTAFASGGIVASVLAVVGLALGPFTLGASLGLTAAGIAMGVASGTGGIATEIADKIINSKALKEAQTAIDNYNKKNEKLLPLMDVIRREKGEKKFRTFLEMKLKIISPKFYEWLDKHLGRKVKPGDSNPEPAKAGVRVAAAAGKIAAEVFETGGKAFKFGSFVCSVFTIPLDLHTIVSNSIKIHKMTPSETAEYIRRLADQLESEGQLDEMEELKRTTEKLKREAKRQGQQWMDSMLKIGEDVVLKMEELAVVYDSVKKQALRIQVISLSTHVCVRPLVLYILLHLLISDPESWIHRGALVSLIYDGVYLAVTIAMEAYTYRVINDSRKEIEKGLYAAGNVFKIAPAAVLWSAESRSRSIHTLLKPELRDSSKYYNFFEVGVVLLKSVLNVVILCGFSESGIPSDQDGFSSQSFLTSWLCVFPMSESVYRPDLVIFWLAICTCLLTSSVKGIQENSMSPLAKDVIDLGEHFKRSLNELIGDCNVDPIHTDGMLT